MPLRRRPALLLATLVAAACGARPSRTVAPGVLLIAIDGLRADHLSGYGYDRGTSPVLDALAHEGVRFEQVFASAPLVIPGHAALLTGCEPSQSRRFLAKEFEGQSESRWYVPERLPRLAVEFLAAGYATAGFVEDERLAESAGFALGFQRYEVLDPASAQDWEGPQETRVVEHFLQWLRALPADRPWFAYLELDHLERCWTQRASGEGFFQPRPELSEIPPLANTDSVFFSVPRSRSRGRVHTLGEYEATYDDALRRVDAEVGRLTGNLRRLGRDAATTLSVVGTFGLQLGEAGLYLTSGRYSQADLHVPWILRPRADLALARGASVPGLVSTLDVAPTLYALAGLAQPDGIHGRSQLERLRAGNAPDPTPPGPTRPDPTRPFVFASCGLQEGCAVIGERYVLEYLFPLSTTDAEQRRSWTGTWSEASRQPRLLFYDRSAAPYPPFGESGLEHDPESAPFRSAAVEWLRDMNDLRIFLQSPAGRSELDEATLERLRTKGYLGPARPRA